MRGRRRTDERRAEWDVRRRRSWLLFAAAAIGASLDLGWQPAHLVNGLFPSVLALGGAFVLADWLCRAR